MCPGFSHCSDGKEYACNAGDVGLIPGSEGSPGEGNGYTLQYSCLENSMNRGAWWATVHAVQRVTHNWVTSTGLFIYYQKKNKTKHLILSGTPRTLWNACISIHFSTSYQHLFLAKYGTSPIWISRLKGKPLKALDIYLENLGFNLDCCPNKNFSQAFSFIYHFSLQICVCIGGN